MNGRCTGGGIHPFEFAIYNFTPKAINSLHVVELLR